MTRRHPPRAESGSTLAGVVLALVVLGALAAGAVVAVDNLTGSTATPAGRSGNPITAGAVASCRIDHATVEQAEAAYQAETGRYPPSVAALAVRDAVSGLGPWLKEVPSSTRYSLLIEPATGAITVESPTGHRLAGCASLG